jgi:glycosyltransferase involved in cell wall biosynthesis
MRSDVRPLVSVIIPAFNYGRFVEDAIESAKRQDYPNIEIIVVDDGSTDDTENRLSPRTDITYVRHSNRGLPATRNTGIQLATGEYLQFLDADDLLEPDSVRKRVEALEARTDASFAVCRTRRFGRLTTTRALSWLQPEWRLPAERRLGLDFMHFNIAPPHAFLVRASAVRKHNLLFDTALKACEDYDFWINLARLEGLPAVVDSCFVRYRIHPGSMSKSYANQFHHDAILCRRVFGIFEHSPKWIDPGMETDFLCAMLSAATLTARRLWHERRNEFQEFLDGHAMMLLWRLVHASGGSPPSPDAYVYLSKARATLAKMCWKDKSITEAPLSALIHIPGNGGIFFVRSVSEHEPSVTCREIARTAKFDASFALSAFWRIGKRPKASTR